MNLTNLRLFLFGGYDDKGVRNTFVYEFVEDNSVHWQRRGHLYNTIHAGYAKVEYIP